MSSSLVNRIFNYLAFFTFIVFVLYVVLPLQRGPLFNKAPSGGLTVRVNTFRRNDLLEIFLEHYAKCRVVHQIQVVWSDPQNQVPSALAQRFVSPRVIYEKHDSDSLNNRFKALSPILTDAVLSIDDDLVIPCDHLKSSLKVWSSNKRSLVGMSPRLSSFDTYSGAPLYHRWQHTWWNGFYSIMLTKACILHKDFLSDYFRLTPPNILDDITAHRNCEDIAMSHVVALKSKAPPVWVSSVIYETGNTGISSNNAHWVNRGKCLSLLLNFTNGKWPWINGYQKSRTLNFAASDFLRLWYDIK